MDRLRRALDSERNFAAKSAHELRTPIAAALAQTQRVLAELQDAKTMERARQVEETLRGLARLAEKLMQFARAEGGRLLTEQPADCVAVLRVIVDEVRRTTGLGDRLQVKVPNAAVLTRMDPDALSILVRNLVENGARHGDPREPVRLSLGSDGLLSVISHGTPRAQRTPEHAGQTLRAGPDQRAWNGTGPCHRGCHRRGARTSLTLTSPASGFSDGFEARVPLG